MLNYGYECQTDEERRELCQYFLNKGFTVSGHLASDICVGWRVLFIEKKKRELNAYNKISEERPLELVPKYLFKSFRIFGFSIFGDKVIVR